MTFGEYYKKIRLKLGLSLRSFCKQFDIDASNLSKIERGVNPPPKNPIKLNMYIAALGFYPGSPEHEELKSLAEKARGVFVTKGLSDSDLIKKLPVFLRTEDGDPLNDEQLDKLANKIKQAWSKDTPDEL